MTPADYAAHRYTTPLRKVQTQRDELLAALVRIVDASGEVPPDSRLARVLAEAMDLLTEKGQ